MLKARPEAMGTGSPKKKPRTRGSPRKAASKMKPGALEYARAKDLKECCWPTDSQRLKTDKGALIWKGRDGPRLPVSYIGGATFRDAWQSRVAVRLAMKNQNTHASVTSQFANL